MKRLYLLLLMASIAISSSCTKEETVYRDYKGFAYVDLGLPSGLKWATQNVGAKTESQFGDYFCWGEVTPRNGDGINFDCPYKWSKVTWDSHYNWYGQDYYQPEEHIIKYCKKDGLTVLEAEDDPATYNWGGSWRTPTKEEWNELAKNCTWTWKKLGGKEGYEVTGKNGKSIFLPAAGTMSGTDFHDAYTTSYDHEGPDGMYWTSSLNSGIDGSALIMFFWRDEGKKYYATLPSETKTIFSMPRSDRYSIRPVSR